MQKSKARGSIPKYYAAREILPGYPIERVFECKEEVDRYLSGEAVCCLMCGKSYKQLSPHIKRIHGLDSADYRQRYGIPASYALMGTERLRAAKERGASAENMDHLRAMRGLAYSRVLRTEKRRTKFVPMTKRDMAARVNDPSIDRKTYADFSWHLQVMATVWKYEKIAPPHGVASWSGFKKRWLRDPDLKRRRKESRAHFRAARGQE